DRLGATLTQVVVAILTANGISSAFQRQNPMLGIGNVVGQLVESLLGLLGQDGLIEAKVHRGFSDYMVVIQISHLIGQRVHAGRGLGGRGLGLVSQLAGILRLLIGGGSAGVHVRDALLRADIQILDVAR